MSVIYQPKGRALEYSELACNLYMGCTHGCRYCFAPACMRSTKEAWSEHAYPRNDIIRQFRKEAAKLAANGEKRPILFSFLSDPYQPIEKSERLTHNALETVCQFGLKSKILTKGNPELIEEDLALMKDAGTELGITLSFTQERSRQYWEPNASTIQERIELLKKAHAMGITTWVSMEPVIIPDEALELLSLLIPYVDKWKIGKVNHCPEIERQVDWVSFREKAREILDAANAEYYLKKSLTEL